MDKMLQQILTTASDCYYNDGICYTLTDDEFTYIQTLGLWLDNKEVTDDVYDLLSQLQEEDERIGAPVKFSKYKVALPKIMGSLTELKEGDFAKWQKKIKCTCFKAMEKLDGISCLLEYSSEGYLVGAYTRGDGLVGQNILRHAERISSIPNHTSIPTWYCGIDKFYVWGELIIPRNNGDEILTTLNRITGREYKNLRNTVAGQINADKAVDYFYKNVNFVAYGCGFNEDGTQPFSVVRQLAILGPAFETVNTLEFPEGTITDINLQRMNETLKAGSRYECDGIVLIMGETGAEYDTDSLFDYENSTGNSFYDVGTHNPSFMRKYKLTTKVETAETEVEYVEWNATKTGLWMPRVRIKPVQLQGVSISFATGFNGEFIEKNGIGVGAKITIKRAGDVIPHIVSVIKPVKPDLPADFERQKEGPHFLIKNNQAVEEVRFKQIRYFFALEEIAQAKEGNLRCLWNNGYDTIQKILSIDRESITRILGANGSKMYTSIHTHVWEIHRVLAGAGIFGSGVGDKILKDIVKVFGSNYFRTPCEWTNIIEDLISINGVHFKTANKIKNNLSAAQEFISSLPKFMNIQDPFIVEPKVPEGLQYNVIFSGIRDKDLENKIRNKGHKVLTSMSSKVNLVITNDVNGNTTKLKDARMFQIPIIDINAAREAFGD